MECIEQQDVNKHRESITVGEVRTRLEQALGGRRYPRCARRFSMAFAIFATEYALKDLAYFDELRPLFAAAKGVIGCDVDSAIIREGCRLALIHSDFYRCRDAKQEEVIRRVHAVLNVANTRAAALAANDLVRWLYSGDPDGLQEQLWMQQWLIGMLSIVVC